MRLACSWQTHRPTHANGMVGWLQIVSKARRTKITESESKITSMHCRLQLILFDRDDDFAQVEFFLLAVGNDHFHGAFSDSEPSRSRFRVVAVFDGIESRLQDVAACRNIFNNERAVGTA